jgi:hypothetical protein
MQESPFKLEICFHNKLTKAYFFGNQYLFVHKYANKTNFAFVLINGNTGANYILIIFVQLICSRLNNI